jgi:pyridoxamine 5'-phosphate oxidase
MPGASGWSSRLDGALDHLWVRLNEAARNPGSPLRPLVVANSAADGPDARVMLLRGADRGAASLVFHTDSRSPKFAGFISDPDVAIIGYDDADAYQLRLRGTAQFEPYGPERDAAWKAVRADALRNFMTILPPSATSPVATDGQPPEPDRAAARVNFVRMFVTLTHVEWLSLDPSGHRRAAYTCSDAGWTGRWLIP